MTGGVGGSRIDASVLIDELKACTRANRETSVDLSLAVEIYVPVLVRTVAWQFFSYFWHSSCLDSTS